MSDTNAPATFPNISKRYTSDGILGQGGMGIVYRAYDNITKRPVAVKTMWGDMDPSALDLFEREWTALARLSHPNIVDILDTGEFTDDNGQRKPYFVMPLLPGKTLDEIIKKESQRLTVDRVIEIIRQACRGLQAAHDQEVIHRDLKPSNIFVMDDDTAKIIDFGVAHLADAHSVTGTKGTLQYMAPEQIDMSSPVSPRSDIFSLAVVCYEALTGRKPFARRTEGDTIDAIRAHIPPPASEINGEVNNLIARTVHKAMAKQPWHRFASAKEFADTLQRAMRNEPIERFDRAKIQPRIERMKRAYSEGDNQFALEILSELESEGHIDPDMPVLRMQIEQSVRQRNIRQLLENARTRMEGDEHPLALQKLGEVLALDPNNADALSLRSQIERQRSEKQIEQWFRLVDEHRQNQLFSQAKQGLQEILKIDSSNTRARTMLAEIEQTEQEINKFREEKQRMYEGAMASYRNGEISSALSKLERGLDLSRRPNTRTQTTELDAQYQSFYNQVRSERDAARNAYAEGRKSLEDKNALRALDICEEYLQKHPSDPMFQALKLEAEEMQRQEQSASIAELNRRADSESDLDKKLNIIKDACERFPNEPHFKSSLKLIRDRRDLVNSIVARARQYEERGQFGEATNQWDILRNIYPIYPGLDFEVERLGRHRQEHAHAEAKAHWMERIDSHFAAGEYSKAHGVIQEALADFPNDKELEGLGSLAEQGVRRSAEANILLAQGRDLCTAKNFDAGLDALRKAERLDPRNTATRATLLSCLVEHSRDLISRDWHAAEPLIQEAAALNAEDPVVRSLSSLLDSQKRQEAINGFLVEARGLQAADDIPGALKKVEEGLAEYPNEVRLSQLHNTLRAAAVASKTEVTSASPAPPKETPADFSATSFMAASSVSQPKEQDAVKSAPPPPPVKPVPPPPKPQPIVPPVKPLANPPGPKKPIWLWTVLAAAGVIFASLLYTFIHKPSNPPPPPPRNPNSVKVTLTANQPGATFKVDGATVPESTTLAPGQHTGEAELSGFTPDTHSFTVPATAAAPVNIAFSLSPALPSLTFSSGLAHGTAVFDDAPPVDLQEGLFSKSEIVMGTHHVRILDGSHEIVSFTFDAEPRQLIKLTSPLTSRESSGIAVSSLAGAAQIYGTPGLKAGLSGQPPQNIPADGLSVPAANPPQHVSIMDGGKTRDLTPDPSPLPILTVMLTGGIERIPVTLTANVPDAEISLDGTLLKRKMVDGSRTLPLPPGVVTVVVSHDGFQPSAPQKLVLRAGDEPKHLEFNLTAIIRMASFTITGAPPDAAVYLDDVRAGTINATGGFTKDVSPATHQIAVRKAGLEEFKQSHEFKAGDNFPLAVQMRVASASVVLHVTPASARITISHNSEIFTPQNGQTASLPPGAYTLTATAEKYTSRSEPIQVELGKPLPIDWILQPEKGPVAVDPHAVPFADPSSWKFDGGWITHTANGASFYTGAPGNHTVDILKHKKMFGAKRVVFLADFTGKGNYTQYSLDGHSLYKTVYTDGKAAAPEAKIPFGQENGETMRMLIETSSDSFVIKNRAGTVIDSIKKAGIGRFGFQDDVTVHITP